MGAAPKPDVDARNKSGSSRAATLLALPLMLAACSLITLTDPYGNTYGDWYNHGTDYRWQLTMCEQAIVDGAVPNADRKRFMRCCMWRHGVPIDDPGSCSTGLG
jgi:hypothetical protein